MPWQGSQVVAVRKSGVVLAVIGVLLIAVAVVLRLVIVPGQAQVPSDTDTTHHYKGTYAVLLNPAALTSGDLSTLFLRNVPVAIDRTVRVTDTDGQKAIVNDARTVKTTDGTDIGKVDYNFAIDRKTLEPVAPFGGADVTPAKGLTVSYPFGTDKKDYTGYVEDTQGTTVTKYSGETKTDGVTTYLFKATVPPTQVTEPKVLANYPPSMPKSLLSSLPKALGFTDAQAASFGQLLAAVPDPVPLVYQYAGETSIWVEPSTGSVVNMTRTESTTANIAAPGSSQLVPLTTVSDLSYAQTPASVSEAASDAKDGADKLALFGTTLPLISLILGFVLLVASFFFRRPPEVAAPGPGHEEILPTKTD
jgi:hypothetical protein